MVRVITFLLFVSQARAEYRAYELAITNAQTGQSRTVTSTLDDIQYTGYYPLNKDETIEIRATWMCWKRSERFKPICPNPNAAPGPTTNSTPDAPTAP